MNWNAFKIDKLKQLCRAGKGNREIAALLDCNLTEVYAKRSQLGITIAKCKGIDVNPKFEEALAPIAPKGMRKDVRNGFAALEDIVLLAMASDWTSTEDVGRYAMLHEALMTLEEKYNARIGK